MSNNKLAIFLIIISVFFGTVMLSFLRIAQEDVNVYVAGFFRFFLGLVIIMPYIFKTNFVVLKTNHIKKHLLFFIAFLNKKTGNVRYSIEYKLPCFTPPDHNKCFNFKRFKSLD